LVIESGLSPNFCAVVASAWLERPIALLAAPFPDRMLALVMGEVERIADDPERPRRVAALERELDDLHRLEESLLVAAIATGQPVHRSPSAPPAAALGVCIEAKVPRAA
jgi:hypothetical protein